MLVAPGAYDAIGARLVAQAGFGAVYMTGAGTSAACGFPDFGLVSMTEMVDNAARMAAAVQVPLIADADTGYGNELNVTRTVRAYEARGVAAIHIEDQESPKRCGHLDGKVVIPREAFVSKIRAATEATAVTLGPGPRRPAFLTLRAQSPCTATAPAALAASPAACPLRRGCPAGQSGPGCRRARTDLAASCDASHQPCRCPSPGSGSGLST